MRNNKPRALIILTPGFPESEADTTSLSHLQTFVRALKEVDPHVEVIVLTLTYPFVSTNYQWYGLKVISFGNKHKGPVFNVASILKMWVALRKLNKQYQIIGLLSFWLGKCAFIAGLFSKRHRLTHYCWLLGQDARAGNKYFARIKPAAGSIIAVSDFVAKELKKNYGLLPRHVIPIGIDTALFNCSDIDRDIDILGAGSLIPLKQYHLLLEIIKCLKYLAIDVKTVLCGDGPEMAHLQKLIDHMGLQNNITLTGELPHTEVLKLMRRSKILLHPSNYEGFSTVCLEALYAGAKVVSFIRPMDTDIPNWYIAENTEEMLQLSKDILQDTHIRYKAVAPYLVQNNARAIIKLFDTNEQAIA